MDTDDIDEELTVRHGLPKHYAITARMVMVTIRSALDVIEQQAPSTFRAVAAFSLEHERELPAPRARVRAALRTFIEHTIVEAEAREAELVRAVTGEEPKG